MFNHAHTEKAADDDKRPANPKELRQMKKLYLQAFPKSERKPFRLMRKKAREGVMELLVIHEKKELLGLAITVHYKDMVFRSR